MVLSRVVGLDRGDGGVVWRLPSPLVGRGWGWGACREARLAQKPHHECLAVEFGRAVG